MTHMRGSVVLIVLVFMGGSCSSSHSPEETGRDPLPAGEVPVEPPSLRAVDAGNVPNEEVCPAEGNACEGDPFWLECELPVPGIECCKLFPACTPAGVIDYALVCDDSCAQGCGRITSVTACEYSGCNWFWPGGCGDIEACWFSADVCPLDDDCVQYCGRRVTESSCSSASEICTWSVAPSTPVCLDEPGPIPCSMEGDCVPGQRCKPFTVNPCAGSECEACGAVSYFCAS